MEDAREKEEEKVGKEGGGNRYKKAARKEKEVGEEGGVEREEARESKEELGEGEGGNLEEGQL
jgi:hypothetical protein